MYIDPFMAGILVTILCELGISFALSLYFAFKHD